MYSISTEANPCRRSIYCQSSRKLAEFTSALSIYTSQRNGDSDFYQCFTCPNCMLDYSTRLDNNKTFACNLPKLKCFRMHKNESGDNPMKILASREL